jgi:hypothetical protein
VTLPRYKLLSGDRGVARLNPELCKSCCDLLRRCHSHNTLSFELIPSLFDTPFLLLQLCLRPCATVMSTERLRSTVGSKILMKVVTKSHWTSEQRRNKGHENLPVG